MPSLTHRPTNRPTDLPTYQPTYLPTYQPTNPITSQPHNPTPPHHPSGLYLWTDRSLYEPKVLLTSIPKTPITMAAPTVQAEVEASAALVQSNGEGGARGSGGKKRRLGQGLAAEEEDGVELDEDGELAAQVVHAVADGDQVDGPISDGVVTLSGLPRSRWESLFNLEVVKERNKPAEPPKPPPRAPFFLPTLRGERGVTPAFGDASGAEGAGAGAGAGVVAGAGAGAEGEDEAAPMAGWGDAWSDDDAGGEGGEGGDDGWGEDEEDDESGGAAMVDAGSGTKSRLLKNSGAMAVGRGCGRYKPHTTPHNTTQHHTLGHRLRLPHLRSLHLRLHRPCTTTSTCTSPSAHPPLPMALPHHHHHIRCTAESWQRWWRRMTPPPPPPPPRRRLRRTRPRPSASCSSR